MSSGSQHPTTNEAGIPVASDEHSLSVGADGPIVMHDHYLMEQMAADAFFAGPQSAEAKAFLKSGLLW